MSSNLRECLFPEVAGVIRARESAILERWQEAVKQALPTADELTLAQLRDDLPFILARLAGVLEDDSSDAGDAGGAGGAGGAREGGAGDARSAMVEDFSTVSSAHGAIRFHQSYNLSELFTECELLRRVLLEEVSTHMNRPIDVDEVIALNMGLDMAVRSSVLAFVNHQTRELQGAAEAQSRYLSFLSHDLRGSMNGVVLMIEVLKRELAGQQQFAESLQDLDLMRRSILETVGTMDRFLHAERFRKGKVQVHPVKLDVKTLVSELIGQFAHQAHDKSLSIHADGVHSCPIFADKALLNLILQNLVSNAVKFSKRGEIVITTSPCSADSGEGALRISVRDQGPGIGPETLSKLFTPFVRGDTHGQHGVGLGLSIARQAADLLGARVWAESEPGKGSTFHLEIIADSADHDGQLSRSDN